MVCTNSLQSNYEKSYDLALSPESAKTETEEGYGKIINKSEKIQSELGKT